ncbi:phage shock protein PspA [Novosphingobium sp. RD2P27]|uniref:Phage shock protein PspA n=1 Tax=Novosphingobium kalidii TaxID=3230299 RepID=A0ABV2D428_9SPHN
MTRLEAEIAELRGAEHGSHAARLLTLDGMEGVRSKRTVSRPYPYPYADRPKIRKGIPKMGIFSRTRDIIAANFNDLLEKAEDPAKMIRLIILEMEETLVEVRTSSARTIADQKEMRRHVAKLDKLQADWADKAQLALSKAREDLARAALLEKKKAADMADQLKAEIEVLDDALRAYEQDIEKLQSRLREARTRQTSIAARLQSAENRVKLRSLLASERVDEAMVRFDQLERRVDYAEGRAESMSMGDSRQPSLSDEIAALADGDSIEAELAEMKRAMGDEKAENKTTDSPLG